VSRKAKMDPKDSRKFWPNVCTRVQLVAGTAVRKKTAIEHALLHKWGVDPDMFVKSIFFDSQVCPPSDLDDLLEFDTDKLFGPSNVVLAAIPTDPEALERAEQEGLLRHKPEGWYRNPGVSLDSFGASADPTTGLTLILFNEFILVEKLARIIQQAVDHDRQYKLVLEGYQMSWIPARIIMSHTFSALGGMGPGAMYWALKGGLRACAKKDGVQAKIVTKVLCRGNLTTHDDEQADRNAYTSIKFIQVTDSGMYVDPPTGLVLPRLSDLTFISSNQNNNGIIGDLDRLHAHEANTDTVLWHTEAGREVRERLTDIETPEPDEYGDPRAAVTASCATISRDSKRVIKYLSNMSSAIFAESLTARGDADEIHKHAAGLARLYGLTETERDSCITGPLTRPAEWRGESIADTARESLFDRLGNTSGLERATLLDTSIVSICNSDIQETYEPMIRKQAHKKRQSVQENLNNELGRRMHRLYGIWESQRILAVQRLALDKSSQIIMGKINDLRELLLPHEQVLAEAAEQLKNLRESGWLNRSLNLLLTRAIIGSLESSGCAAIDYQLQIAACTIAIQDFLNPLIEYVDSRLAWLSMAGQKLGQMAQRYRNTAKSTAKMPTWVSVPLGIELADEKYLHNCFEDYLHAQGGPEKLADNILNRLLNKHGSIAFLAEQPVEEITEVIRSACEDIFRPLVESKDVVDEFQRLYPDENSQQRIFDQLVRHSEGRVTTTGELNRTGIWLKAISVPSTNNTEWARQMVNSVDKKSGKWDLATHSDPNKIYIIQLRNNISLTSILKRLHSTDDPQDWPKLIGRAPEPVSTLIVNPNPTLRQFKRVLAKAIVNGQLTVDEGGCYSLNLLDGQKLDLGDTFEKVEAALRPNWPYLVFIESSFGHNLVVDDEQVTSKLDHMKTQLQSQQTSADPRLNLIDDTAVEEAVIQAELFLPWARRMRKANRKRITT
jgi:hypothetical protein